MEANEKYWEELDKLETADEIRWWLNVRQVRGVRLKTHACPLAIATDCLVEPTTRISSTTWREVHLTEAEQRFVRLFDLGEFPELEDHCDAE